MNQVNAEVDSSSLLEMHNRERAKGGLPALQINPALNASATQKAQAMLAANCWSHYCPDNRSPWEFFKDSGYSYIYAGENLAEGFYDNEAVVTAWMNSPTHMANVMSANFTEVGFGFARGRFQNNSNNVIIAVHFGKPSTRQEFVNLESNFSAPEILSPSNSSYLSSKTIDIYGTSNAGTNVNILLNGSKSFSANVADGNFTAQIPNLADDTYTLTAQAANGSSKSSFSKPVVFTIDTVADPITSQDFTITSDLFDTRISLNRAEISLARIIFPLAGAIELTPNQNGVLTASVKGLSEEQFQAHVVDLAGNITNSEIKLADVLVTQSHQTLLPNLSALNIINLAVITGLIVFLLIDIYYYTKHKQAHTHYHLHLGVLFVMAIVILISNINGEILNGIKL